MWQRVWIFAVNPCFLEQRRWVWEYGSLWLSSTPSGVKRHITWSTQSVDIEPFLNFCSSTNPDKPGVPYPLTLSAIGKNILTTILYSGTQLSLLWTNSKNCTPHEWILHLVSFPSATCTITKRTTISDGPAPPPHPSLHPLTSASMLCTEH